MYSVTLTMAWMFVPDGLVRILSQAADLLGTSHTPLSSLHSIAWKAKNFRSTGRNAWMVWADKKVYVTLYNHAEQRSLLEHMANFWSRWVITGAQLNQYLHGIFLILHINLIWSSFPVPAFCYPLYCCHIINYTNDPWRVVPLKVARKCVFHLIVHKYKFLLRSKIREKGKTRRVGILIVLLFGHFK